MPTLAEYKKKLLALEEKARALIAQYQSQASVTKVGKEQEVKATLDILKRFESVSSEGKVARHLKSLERRVQPEALKAALQAAEEAFVVARTILETKVSEVHQQQEALELAHRPLKEKAHQLQEQVSMRREEHAKHVQAYEARLNKVQGLLEELPHTSDAHTQTMEQLNTAHEKLRAIEEKYMPTMQRLGKQIARIEKEIASFQQPESKSLLARVRKVTGGSHAKQLLHVQEELHSVNQQFNTLEKQCEAETKELRQEITRLLDVLGTPGSEFKAAVDERHQLSAELDAMKAAYKREVFDLNNALGEANQAVDAHALAHAQEQTELMEKLRGVEPELQELTAGHVEQVQKIHDEMAQDEQALAGVGRMVDALEKDVKRATGVLQRNIDTTEDTLTITYQNLSRIIQAVEIMPLTLPDETLRKAHRVVENCVAEMQELDKNIGAMLSKLEGVEDKAGAIAGVKSAYEAYVLADKQYQEVYIEEKRKHIRQDMKAFQGRLEAYYVSVAANLDLLGPQNNLANGIEKAKSMDELLACEQKLQGFEGALLKNKHDAVSEYSDNKLNELVDVMRAVDSVFQTEIEDQSKAPKVQAQLKQTRNKVFDALVEGATIEEGLEKGCKLIDEDLVGDMSVRLKKDIAMVLTALLVVGLVPGVRRLLQGKTFFYSQGKPEAIEANKHLKDELKAFKDPELPDDGTPEPGGTTRAA
jgi:hypothetical protein